MTKTVAKTMETRHRIEDKVLRMRLDEAYGLRTDSVRFIPMGDSAYSYRVDDASGDRYYLKLFDRRNDRQRQGIERLRYYLPLTWRLHHLQLYPYATYPIRNRHGDYATSFPDVTIVLFNFIEGETLAEAYPFPPAVVERIARSIADIHRLTPAVDRAMLLTETFDLSFVSELERGMEEIERNAAIAHPARQALQELLRPAAGRIADLARGLGRLREAVAAQPTDFVLCHGDVWGGNLIRQGDEWFVIDWESAMLAPPEYDWFGYLGEPFETFYAAYERHAGRSVAVRPDLLRFYAYRHHLRNMTNWMLNILYRNVDEAQHARDLDLLAHHCMNRWDRIEPDVAAAEAIVRRLRSSERMNGQRHSQSLQIGDFSDK